MPTARIVPLFDLDGTLVDSDAALLAPFTALGVAPDRVPLGLPLGEACALAGIRVEDYVARYDTGAVQPFPGVDELIAGLSNWGVCSNKTRAAGRAELTRLGWAPVAALFSEDFDRAPKQLGPLLAVLGLDPAEVIFVGDTEHDRVCARASGVRFALAGWNARVRAEPGDTVLRHPSDLLELIT